MNSLLQIKINNTWTSVPLYQGDKGPTPIKYVDYWVQEDREAVIKKTLAFKKLATPQITLNNTHLTIVPVPHAQSYEIYINNSLALTTIRTDDIDLSGYLRPSSIEPIYVVARAPFYLDSAYSNIILHNNNIIITIEENDFGLTYHITASHSLVKENE